MPDTGAPWNIPYVESTDLVSDWPTDSLALANAVASGLTNAGIAFDASETITATNATWPVPTLGNTIVKVTVVGGGGGGGGAEGSRIAGAAGNTSSFVSSAGTISALGGYGGNESNSAAGANANDGLCSGNGGEGGVWTTDHTALNGGGGEVKVGYLDLNGVSTANVTIGAGGAGGAGANNGGDGGDGVVIVEYQAG